MREERPRGWRPIEPGELHAVLASAGDGQADHRRVLTTAPRAISGYRWHSARHSRLSAAPRRHRVRRLLAPRCGGAPGRATVPKKSRFSPVLALSPAARAAEWRGCVKCASRGLAGRVRRRVTRAGPPRSGAARERAVANVLLSVPVQQLPDTNGNGSGRVALVGPAMPGRRFSRSNLWTAFHEADLADPKLPRSGLRGPRPPWCST